MLQISADGPRAAPAGAALRVTVPATVGNMGAGFDVLGLALNLHNEFHVTQATETLITGDGLPGALPTGESNLFYRAFAHLYAAVGRPAPALRVRMRQCVPAGRGLGSSATAVVGGLLAANAYLGVPFAERALLAHAVELEHGRHPDNVAPALLGGLVVNVMDGAGVLATPVPWPAELRAVLFMPEFDMDTVQGRALMPSSYSRADVVFNCSRAALFVAAIAGRHYDLLRVAMEDRLHQPYRTQLFPLLPALIAAALAGGAVGACLAGGGSSVLALATDHFAAVAAGMEATARAAGLTGHALVLDIACRGADVTTAEACP